MKNGTQQPRSIAAELALLSLAELEPRIADDPELLVSTEAVLSFAAIKNSDPVQWERWRSVLERDNKVALIEHMLGEPEHTEDSEWQSKADRLIGLAADAGLEPPPATDAAVARSWGQVKRGDARETGSSPDNVAERWYCQTPRSRKRDGKVQQRKVNQCQRPLDSSTGSNLVDMGWRSAGWATSYRSSARPRPQSDGLDEAVCMLRMMHGEAAGV